MRGDLLDFGSFRFGFPKLRLTDVEAGEAGGFVNFAERASGEGEKIGADRPSFGKNREALARSAGGGLRFDGCVGDGGPVFWGGELEMEAGFEVGLIEAGESHFGIHGDEEGVEIFGVVVFVFEARDGFCGLGDGSIEVDGDSIFSGADGTGRKLDVSVLDFCGDGDAVDDEFCRRAFAEIEENGSGRIGMELQIFVSRGRGRVGREREAEVVAEVGKLRGALAGEVAGNAVGRRSGMQDAGGRESEECE